MERTTRDVDAFLDGLGGERGEDIRELDALIRAELSGLDRALWEGPMWGGTHQEIVGYGSITQERPRGAAIEWFLIGLAEQKAHISVYVNASEGGDYLVRRRAKALGAVKVGAAAVTFDRLADIDRDELVGLVRRARELAGL
jgi:hypothetical protein